jgi:hypothetical protein
VDRETGDAVLDRKRDFKDVDDASFFVFMDFKNRNILI